MYFLQQAGYMGSGWVGVFSLIFLLKYERKREKGEMYIVQGGDQNPTWLSKVHLYVSLNQTSFTTLGPLVEGLGNREPDGKEEEINKCMCDVLYRRGLLYTCCAWSNCLYSIKQLKDSPAPPSQHRECTERVTQKLHLLAMKPPSTRPAVPAKDGAKWWLQNGKYPLAHLIQ